MNKTYTKLNKLIEKAKAETGACFRDFFQEFPFFVRDIKKSVEFGNLDQARVRIVVLIGLIIFTGYFIAIKQYYCDNFLGSLFQTKESARN